MEQLYCVSVAQRSDSGGSSAPTLLWIHGLLGSSNTFSKHIPLFSGYRSIAIDLLGFGRSAKPTKRKCKYTVAEHVAAVDKVRRVWVRCCPRQDLAFDDRHCCCTLAGNASSFGSW